MFQQKLRKKSKRWKKKRIILYEIDGDSCHTRDIENVCCTYFALYFWYEKERDAIETTHRATNQRNR